MSFDATIDAVQDTLYRRDRMNDAVYVERIHTQVMLVTQELDAYMRHVSQAQAARPGMTTAGIDLAYDSAQDKRSMITYFLGVITSITSAVTSPSAASDSSELDRFDDTTKNLLVAACECWSAIDSCYCVLKYEHCKEIQSSNQNSIADLQAKLIDASSNLSPFYDTDAVGQYIQVCESIIEKVLNTALKLAEAYPKQATAIRDMCKEAIEAIVIPIQSLTKQACARDSMMASTVMEPSKSVYRLGISAPAAMDKRVEEINGHLIKIMTAPVIEAICYNSLRQSVLTCEDSSDKSIRKMRALAGM